MDARSDSFGYWLRRRRLALDLTQVALAEKVSCSQAAIKKIEAQERRPSARLAQRLAEHLGVPAHEREAFLAAARSFSAAQRLQRDALPLATPPALTPAALAAASPLVAAAPTLPLVGREQECQRLEAALAGLGQGGQVLLLQGEAGIGKSRLLAELQAGARALAMPVLTTNCYEIERAIAYQPVIDLATQACSQVPQLRLRQIAPVLLAEIVALVPVLAASLAGLPPLSVDVPQARQARLFDALVRLLDALADGRPLLLVIDNLQWADDASLTFVHFLARQLAGRPVLLACAYRDEELAGDERLAALLDSLRREPNTLQMTLPRLKPADTETLLGRLADPALRAPGLAGRLHRETGGNPFFLWSIVQSLGEGEGHRDADTALPLPDAVRDSVRARLARVPQAERMLLELAAVFGRRFDFETLLAHSELPESALVDSLDALVRRRLLHEEDDGSYDFNHDKLREVVYLDVGSARRVLLHRQLAERLERAAGEAGQDHYARLAEHFERGKAWPQAVRYLALAADRSSRLFAMRESLHWFDRAVALLQAHPEVATGPQQLTQLLEQRGLTRVQAGQIEGAVADFQRVIEAARAGGEIEHARDVLIHLGMAYRRADAFEPALACLQEALAVSRATGDERHAADTLYHLGTVAWSNGRNDLAIDHHQQAVEICESMVLTDLVGVQAFHGRGEAHLANGEPAAAAAAFARSLALARAIDDKSYEAENLMMIGWACSGHLGLADYMRALSHFDESLAIARAADLQWHLGPTLIGRAYARGELGRYGEAWSDLAEALPRLQTLGLVRYQLMTHDAMGSVLLELAQPKAALQHFESGLQLAAGAGIRYWVPRLQANRVLAQLAVGLAPDRAALQEASARAQRHHEIWQLLRCLQAEAEMVLAAGDGAECTKVAERLLDLAEAGAMRQVQAQALRLRGLSRLVDGDLEAALQDLARALALAEQIGNPRLVWDCQQALAGVAAARGDDLEQAHWRSGAAEIAGRIERSLDGSGLACGLAALGQSTA